MKKDIKLSQVNYIQQRIQNYFEGKQETHAYQSHIQKVLKIEDHDEDIMEDKNYISDIAADYGEEIKLQDNLINDVLDDLRRDMIIHNSKGMQLFK